MLFPGTEMRLTDQQFPGSSSLPFLKTGAIFSFLQPPGTSPTCHDFSNMVESGFATI